MRLLQLAVVCRMPAGVPRAHPALSVSVSLSPSSIALQTRPSLRVKFWGKWPAAENVFMTVCSACNDVWRALAPIRTYTNERGLARSYRLDCRCSEQPFSRPYICIPRAYGPLRASNTNWHAAITQIYKTAVRLVFQVHSAKVSTNSWKKRTVDGMQSALRKYELPAVKTAS